MFGKREQYKYKYYMYSHYHSKLLKPANFSFSVIIMSIYMANSYTYTHWAVYRDRFN